MSHEIGVHKQIYSAIHDQRLAAMTTESNAVDERETTVGRCRLQPGAETRAYRMRIHSRTPNDEYPFHSVVICPDSP
jgi:hypothetical protein